MPPTYTSVITTILPGSGGVPSESTNAVMLDSVSAGLTATASGTQSTALLLSSKINSVSTVATAGDAVRLPPSFPGLSITVRNGAAANAMNVYPSSATQGGVTGGDNINALSANVAYSQAVGTVTFRCYVLGTWETN